MSENATQQVLQQHLFVFSPHWKARVEGPLVPAPGGRVRLVTEFELLAGPDRESVEAEVITKIGELCEKQGIPFQAHEWNVLQLIIHNGN